MKKLKKSSALHLWNDHSGMIQVEDMKENSIFILLRYTQTDTPGTDNPLYCCSEEHCPMTYHREIKKLLPTAVR